MAQIINGEKFVTITELRDKLNSYIAEHHLYEPNPDNVHLDYTTMDIIECYAWAKEMAFRKIGLNTNMGDYDTRAADGTIMFSKKAVQLMHDWGNYDCHESPMMDEGARELFD